MKRIYVWALLICTAVSAIAQETKAFIQGRDISLDNKQKQMYERYKHKYKIN